MGTTDDERGVSLTMADPSRTPFLVLILSSSPMLVGALTAVVLGTIVALLSFQLGFGSLVSVLGGVAAFIAGLSVFMLRTHGQI